MFGRIQLLVLIIDVIRHGTSIISSKFEIVRSPNGAEWCSVDRPSVVKQTACGDMAATCALECLKDGCCLLHQFKANSYQCELFEYTTTNFSVIPSCSSQRITRNGQIGTQRTAAYVLSPYLRFDKSNGQCQATLLLFYVFVTDYGNKVIDIAGDNVSLVIMPKSIGKMSQLWYFDVQGYIRSAVNGSGVEITGGVSVRGLGVRPYTGNSNQQWKFIVNQIFNQNTNSYFNVNAGSNFDGNAIIFYGVSNCHLKLTQS